MPTLYDRVIANPQREQQDAAAQRTYLLKKLDEAWDGLSPADRQQALQAASASFQKPSKKHPVNLPAPTNTSQAGAMDLGNGVTIPAAPPVTVKGPAPKNWQEAVQGAVARATPAGEQEQQRKLEQIRTTQAGKAPSPDAAKRKDYEADPDPNKGTYEEWTAKQSAKGRTEGSPPKPKGPFQQYEDAYRKQYNIDANEPLAMSDLGYLVEQMKYDQAHGTQSVVTHLERQPDGTMLPVTVWNTTGVKGAPKSPREGGQPAAGQPGPRKAASGPGARVSVGKTIGQSKGDAGTTPTQVKAKKDYVDAVALADLARSVASKPNDAINQKRLLVQLERQSAGRFTVQALDYVKQSGWGNTLEEWASKPDTGALPADVLRQIVDGANQNLASKKAALDTANQLEAPPAPKNGTSGSDSDVDAIVNALKKKPQ